MDASASKMGIITSHRAYALKKYIQVGACGISLSLFRAYGPYYNHLQHGLNT
jgi:hypothetical protein